MNDLQRAIFDIFQAYVDICDTLHLRYFMINGSALGARKYQGFIPWDDDIDVAMPREDYEIFCSRAQSMLPSRIFVQNYKTDRQFPHPYAKLRNSDTTFLESGVEHLEMNHGIWMDIFPLDGYPEENKQVRTLKIRKRILTWKLCCAFRDKSSLKIRMRNSIFRAIGFHRHTAETLVKLDHIVSRYGENQQMWCNHGAATQQKSCIPREYYGKGIRMQFEGRDVVVPEKIDDYLKLLYGEWEKELPREKQRSHHKYVICDLNLPYSDYLVSRKDLV